MKVKRTSTDLKRVAEEEMRSRHALVEVNEAGPSGDMSELLSKVGGRAAVCGPNVAGLKAT